MNRQDELYHYGVKGMRWGHRKKYYNDDGSLNDRGRAKQAYKDAKKATKSANKELRRVGRTAFGVKGIARYDAAKKKADSAYGKEVAAKANYKSKMARDEKAAERAEFRTYKKAIRKSGLPGSISDAQSGGKSTAVYNSMKAKKGKEYADKVVSKAEKQVVAELVGTLAVSYGLAFTAAYLSSKN